MARIATGDESSLRRLYDRYSDAMQAVAFRILRERADSDEVVAEAFAQVWRQAATFEASRGSVAAWLTTVTRSRALDAMRARQRRERVGDAATDASAVVPPGMGAAAEDTDYQAEQNERREHVGRALKGLSAEQRETIELAYFGGRTHSEIASYLGQPLGTIKTRIRSGMQILRERLRPLYAETRHD